MVAPNIHSLAQAYVYRDVAKAITQYTAVTMDGFAMLQVDHAKKEH